MASYRAFIAATKKDLEKHREYVAKNLRDSGITVDPMENWPADTEHPATLSAKSTAGCHFCVCLIAFKRGTVAQNDKQLRSITEIEVDAAKRNGAKILIYMLRDTPQNRSAWNAEHSDFDDKRFWQWRRQLEQDLTCSYFDAHTLPDVLPSVTRQVIRREQAHRRRLSLIVLALGVSFTLFLSTIYISANFRKTITNQYLTLIDPIVFANLRKGDYNFSRLLDGRSDIQDNTNFRDEILSTRQSFSMFANTFGSFRDYEAQFELLAARGVQIRICLTDFSEQNFANWKGYNTATYQSDVTTSSAIDEETLLNAKNIVDLINGLRSRYPKLVELRFSRKQMLYTLWIRDPKLSTGMAHLGITYYGHKTSWPAIRVSQLTGGQQLKSMAEQFEVIWNDAKDKFQ